VIDQLAETVKGADITYLRDEIPKAIDQSLEGVRRVTAIVGAVREFSHPGGDVKALVNLNRAIESTAVVARNEWAQVAELTFEFDPELPLVPCLAAELNQVFLNLIVNAAHAIEQARKPGDPTKGTITLRTQRDGNWAKIEISDTGCGITPENRSKIFDPFFTTKDVGKGTGQGLSISRTIVVKKHHGELSFESTVGKGTTFTIRLPLETEQRSTEQNNTAP
jgi:signal transduction histidine kinase